MQTNFPDNFQNDAPRRRHPLRDFLFVTLLAFALAVTAYVFLYEPDPNDRTPYDDADVSGAAPNVEAFEGKVQKKGRYNFLIVGKDKVSRSTDIMMIVSYDVTGGSINIVQIPRDTYITVDNINSVRINSAYAAYYNRAVKAGDDNPDTAALAKLAAMIQNNFGVRLNYSAVVDIEGFENIIDAVGGVDLDIPYDMYYEDPYQDLYIDLKAGFQHLDGYHAMQYVRYRKGYVQQDIGRQDALKIFMAALMKQIKENMNVMTVVNVAGEVLSNLRSDIGTADFLYFARKSLSVDLSQVYMTTMPGEAAMVEGASVYVTARADAAAVIRRYLNVFDEEFSTDAFDPYGVMTLAGDETVERIYGSPEGTYVGNIYNAEDVNDNPIDIPMG